MQIVFARCAGLDAHKKTVVACRSQPGTSPVREREVQTFGTMTADLLQLVDWLHAWDITHVAMESIGDYWKPIFNLLEGELEVWLVNPAHIKRVPGRKTDAKDAEWLCECLEHGLLHPSFIPPQAQRDLRDLTRYRTTVVQERARVVNRVQKLLEGSNIKLAAVATDVLGLSGRQMLDALAAGERDAAQLAALAHGKLRRKLPQLEQALTGQVRDPQRFLLTQQLAHIDFLDGQITALSQRIAEHLAALSEPSADPPPSAPAPPPADLPPLAPAQAVALLDTIPGVDRKVAEIIVSELGTDMHQFPSAAHAAAWTGLAPGNYQSGGKRLAGRTRTGNRALRSGLVQAAWAASHTKNTYLAAQYHRLVGRRGQKRALVAVAHSILIIAYHMLLRHEPYHELGSNYFDERKKESVANRLVRRLAQLGYAAHLEPLNAAALQAAVG